MRETVWLATSPSSEVKLAAIVERCIIQSQSTLNLPTLGKSEGETYSRDLRESPLDSNYSTVSVQSDALELYIEKVSRE